MQLEVSALEAVAKKSTTTSLEEQNRREGGARRLLEGYAHVSAKMSPFEKAVSSNSILSQSAKLRSECAAARTARAVLALFPDAKIFDAHAVGAYVNDVGLPRLCPFLLWKQESYKPCISDFSFAYAPPRTIETWGSGLTKWCADYTVRNGRGTEPNGHHYDYSNDLSTSFYKSGIFNKTKAGLQQFLNSLIEKRDPVVSELIGTASADVRIIAEARQPDVLFPPDIREKVERARKSGVVHELTLVSEVPEWKLSVATLQKTYPAPPVKDPLLIGFDGHQHWLLGFFDLTPLEDCARGEFTEDVEKD